VKVLPPGRALPTLRAASVRPEDERTSAFHGRACKRAVSINRSAPGWRSPFGCPFTTTVAVIVVALEKWRPTPEDGEDGDGLTYAGGRVLGG
jgi:hypothetical protein